MKGFGGMDPVDDVKMGSENLVVALVGEKRVMERDEGDDDLGVKKKKKKARVDDSSGDIKRVAEIILVLSALGKIRGGRNPTDVEKGLMAEARKKLTEMCETISPKEIIPSDAIRVVTEDLGLNKQRDQRLGFRPPKMSIAEKFLLTKRKMEESKKFAAQSATYSSQRLQTGVGAMTENHNTSIHTAHRTPPEKPTPAKPSVGGSQAAPPIVHVTALASTSSSNQLPANEVKPATVSRGLPSTSSEMKSSSSVLPRVEGAPFRLDGRLNGSVYTSHVQANSSVVEKTSTVSAHLQSGTLAGQANKVPAHIVKVEGPSETTSKVQLQVTRDQTSKPPVIQTAHGNVHNVHQPSQATNATNTTNTTNLQQASSLYTNHSDIARNVQKLLQPRILQRPNWTPPSTDYMSKSVTCQICKVTINDVESLLVCDACEKGVHLKCLQSYNHKGIPMGEWHCPTCLISSNGKPLPPKYGRVTRNMSAPKDSPNKVRMQASSEKVENPDKKVNHQKITANGNSVCQNLFNAGSTASNHTDPVPVLKASNAREVVGANFSPVKKKTEDPSSESRSVPKETTGAVCAPPADKSNDSSVQHLQDSETSRCPPERSISEIKSLPKSEPSQSCPDKPSDMVLDTCSHSEPPCNLQDIIKAELPSCAEVSVNQYHQVNTTELRATSEHNSGCDLRQDNQDIVQTVSVGTSDVGNGAQNCTRSLDLHSVDWVGDILQVVDEKAFYKSCQIKGVVYNLQDHALFRSNNESLRPSKLQALWEDTKTGSKWAIVNRCYIPDDLPEVVCRPCTPENNEVYESNHGSTVRASLIQGPCEVLSSDKFKKENERRIHLGNQANDGLQPVFLCKWFYDESKGLFRPVTD